MPALNLTSIGHSNNHGGLKPVCETYNGDDSDDLDSNSEKKVLGMPEAMSKTFDTSATLMKGLAVPKLDFRKLKHVKETKDWYGY